MKIEQGNIINSRIAFKMTLTFIPGICTQSTAVPVAFERNSVKVSSAIERSLSKAMKIKENISLNRVLSTIQLLRV